MDALDMQVQDSDRDEWIGTEAAGNTECNIMRVGGLIMGPPYPEGNINRQSFPGELGRPGKWRQLGDPIK